MLQGKGRAAFFPPIPYGNIAARPLPGGFNETMARHSKETETDFYALGLQKDLPWRREWAEKVGTRFSLGLLGLQNVVQIDNIKVAQLFDWADFRVVGGKGLEPLASCLQATRSGVIRL